MALLYFCSLLSVKLVISLLNIHGLVKKKVFLGSSSVGQQDGAGGCPELEMSFIPGLCWP